MGSLSPTVRGWIARLVVVALAAIILEGIDLHQKPVALADPSPIQIQVDKTLAKVGEVLSYTVTVNLAAPQGTVYVDALFLYGLEYIADSSRLNGAPIGNPSPVSSQTFPTRYTYKYTLGPLPAGNSVLTYRGLVGPQTQPYGNKVQAGVYLHFTTGSDYQGMDTVNTDISGYLNATSTATATFTPTVTAQPTSSPTCTAIYTLTATPATSGTPTCTPTGTAAGSPATTSTPVDTPAPTGTVVSTTIPSATPASTDTPVPTSTSSGASDPTATAKPAETSTPTPTPTSVPTNTPAPSGGDSGGGYGSGGGSQSQAASSGSIPVLYQVIAEAPPTPPAAPPTAVVPSPTDVNPAAGSAPSLTEAPPIPEVLAESPTEEVAGNPAEEQTPSALPSAGDAEGPDYYLWSLGGVLFIIGGLLVRSVDRSTL